MTKPQSNKLVLIIGLSVIAGCAVTVIDRNGDTSDSSNVSNESHSFTLGESGRFEISSANASVQKAALIPLLDETPSDQPASAVIALDPDDVTATELATSTTSLRKINQSVEGSADISYIIGHLSSTDPCRDGAEVGTIEASFSQGVTSLFPEQLDIPDTALDYVLDGSFTICTTVTSSVDMSLVIEGMDVVFGPPTSDSEDITDDSDSDDDTTSDDDTDSDDSTDSNDGDAGDTTLDSDISSPSEAADVLLAMSDVQAYAYGSLLEMFSDGGTKALFEPSVELQDADYDMITDVTERIVDYVDAYEAAAVYLEDNSDSAQASRLPKGILDALKGFANWARGNGTRRADDIAKIAVQLPEHEREAMFTTAKDLFGDDIANDSSEFFTRLGDGDLDHLASRLHNEYSHDIDGTPSYVDIAATTGKRTIDIAAEEGAKGLEAGSQVVVQGSLAVICANPAWAKFCEGFEKAEEITEKLNNIGEDPIGALGDVVKDRIKGAGQDWINEKLGDTLDVEIDFDKVTDNYEKVKGVAENLRGTLKDDQDFGEIEFQYSGDTVADEQDDTEEQDSSETGTRAKDVQLIVVSSDEEDDKPVVLVVPEENDSDADSGDSSGTLATIPVGDYQITVIGEATVQIIPGVAVVSGEVTVVLVDLQDNEDTEVNDSDPWFGASCTTTVSTTPPQGKMIQDIAIPTGNAEPTDSGLGRVLGANDVTQCYGLESTQSEFFIKADGSVGVVGSDGYFMDSGYNYIVKDGCLSSDIEIEDGELSGPCGDGQITIGPGGLFDHGPGYICVESVSFDSCLTCTQEAGVWTTHSQSEGVYRALGSLENVPYIADACTGTIGYANIEEGDEVYLYIANTITLAYSDDGIPPDPPDEP